MITYASRNTNAKRRKIWAFNILDGDVTIHEKVKAIASEWMNYANIHFDFVTNGDAGIRVKVDKNNGAWSYLGTDALGIPKNRETMNLGFTGRRTILHEFGHVLGLIEEHQNPKANISWNRELVIRELSAPPNLWDIQTIELNVFRKIPADQLPPYREFDPEAIMNMVFSPSWTGGVTIGGVVELSESDRSFMARLYPR